MDHGARIGWRRTVGAVGVLGLCALPVAAVVAAGSEEAASPERGSHDELRFAQPERAAAPVVAARGKTAEGEPYAIRVSRPASDAKQLCVDVEFEDPGTVGGTPAGLLSAGFCASPAERPLAAVMSETFIDPVTLDPLSSPSRFVYGYAADADVSSLRVVAPEGATRTIGTTPAPGMAVSVFGGSAPASARGRGEVIATDASKRTVRRQELDFHGAAHQEAPDAIPGDAH
jgi:hypothetical protein